MIYFLVNIHTTSYSLLLVHSFAQSLLTLILSLSYLSILVVVVVIGKKEKVASLVITL